jgi:hypothetical protein
MEPYLCSPTRHQGVDRVNFTSLSYFKKTHTRMMMTEVVVVVAPSSLSLLLPLNKRMGRPQSESACFGENKNLLLLPGIKSRFLGCAASSLVTILTELSQRQRNVLSPSAG